MVGGGTRALTLTLPGGRNFQICFGILPLCSVSCWHQSLIIAPTPCSCLFISLPQLHLGHVPSRFTDVCLPKLLIVIRTDRCERETGGRSPRITSGSQK